MEKENAKARPFHSNYFQGALQLRDGNKEIIEFIENETSKEGRDDVYISKITKVKNGYDFQFTSNKFLRKLGKRLKEVYGGDLKESEKLFSRNNQTSKNVYRLTVMFRPFPFKKGDLIPYRGEEYIIMSIGKKLQVKGKKDGKRMLLSFDDLK